jgi:hypothetical protein
LCILNKEFLTVNLEFYDAAPLKLPSAPLGSKEYGSLKADLSGAVKGDA